MFFIPNPNLTTEETLLDLSFLKKGKETFEVTVNKPVNFNFIVVDKENTLIAYECQPLLNSGYYHPQPSTEFVVLGQLMKDETTTLPLKKTSHLLVCTIS